MATPIRQLRGTTAELDALPAGAFEGASGVLIVEEKPDGGRAVRVTDGVTPGGVEVGVFDGETDFPLYTTAAGAERVGFLNPGGATGGRTRVGIRYDDTRTRAVMEALTGGVAYRDISVVENGPARLLVGSVGAPQNNITEDAKSTLR